MSAPAGLVMAKIMLPETESAAGRESLATLLKAEAHDGHATSSTRPPRRDRRPQARVERRGHAASRSLR
jgi:hypothetical protein